MDKASELLKKEIYSFLEASTQEVKPKKKVKPLLVFGPTHSGKTVLCKKILEQEFKRKVFIGQIADLLTRCRFLPSKVITGHAAYIVKMCNLEIAPTEFKSTLVIYVCYDPYEMGTSAQLNEKFKLVNLTPHLVTFDNRWSEYASWKPPNERNLGKLEELGRTEEKIHKPPPWEAVGELVDWKSDMASRHRLVEMLPQIPLLLYQNMQRVNNIDEFAAAMECLSSNDGFPYMDHSSLWNSTMDTCALLGALRINGRERFGEINWRSDGRSPYIGKKQKRTIREIRERLERPVSMIDSSFKVLLPAGEPRPKTPAASKQKKQLVSLLDPHPNANQIPLENKKARSAPMCKTCKVAMKGHICPHKKSTSNSKIGSSIQATLSFGPKKILS